MTINLINLWYYFVIYFYMNKENADLARHYFQIIAILIAIRVSFSSFFVILTLMFLQYIIKRTFYFFKEYRNSNTPFSKFKLLRAMPKMKILCLICNFRTAFLWLGYYFYYDNVFGTTDELCKGCCEQFLIKPISLCS